MKELKPSLLPGKKTHRILETLDDGMVIADEVGQIIYSNTSFKTLIGRGRRAKKLPNSLQEITIFNLQDGEKTSVQELYTRLQKRRRVGDYQCTIKSNAPRRGDDPLVSIKATPLLSENDDFEGAVFTFINITEAKEKAFQERRFIHTIGHELKHPLSCMKAYLYYLKKYAGTRKESAEEYIAKLGNQIDLLTNMIHDVVDITKITSQEFTISPQEGEVNAFLEKLITDLQPVYKQHHIIFNKGEKALAYFDELRMQQVLMNLFSNAVKYSPNSHTITVTLTVKKKKIYIAIKDEGIGIPASELRYIFRPYFRSSVSVNQEFKGLGLGLYLCCEIIEKHNGSINAESKEGKGTTMTIVLPRSSSL